jgi:hypothetical protein
LAPARGLRSRRPVSSPAVPNRDSRAHPWPPGGSIGCTGDGCQGRTEGAGATGSERPRRGGCRTAGTTSTRRARRGVGYACAQARARGGQDLRDDVGLFDERDEHIAPAQRGQTRGSTSCTCVIRRAQARFAAAPETSVDWPGSSPTRSLGRMGRIDPSVRPPAMVNQDWDLRF